jgi:plastocyanin
MPAPDYRLWVPGTTHLGRAMQEAPPAPLWHIPVSLELATVRIPASIPAAAVALGAFIFANPAMAAPASVNVVNHSFQPGDVTINAGEGVTWNFQESGHNVDVYDGPEKFSSGKGSAGTNYAHTFNTPGTYQYACDYHSGMQGTVTVVKAAPAAPAAGGSAGSAPSNGSAGSASSAGSAGSAGSTAGSNAANPLDPSSSLGAVDAAAPTIRSGGFKANRLRLQLSTDSRLVVRWVRVGAAGHVVHKAVTRGKKGTVALDLSRWMRSGLYRVHVIAFDAGGNVSRPIHLKRISVR